MSYTALIYSYLLGWFLWLASMLTPCLSTAAALYVNAVGFVYPIMCVLLYIRPHHATTTHTLTTKAILINAPGLKINEFSSYMHVSYNFSWYLQFCKLIFVYTTLINIQQVCMISFFCSFSTELQEVILVIPMGQLLYIYLYCVY